MASDSGTELFASYEAELKLIQASLNDKLEQISDLNGEPRKAALRQAEIALEEASDLLEQMNLEKQNIPTASRSKINQRYRNFTSDIDAAKRKIKELKGGSAAARYTDEPVDEHVEQRQQLLSGTERLDRSSQRLRESQRIAAETEDIGRGTIADLQVQREQIERTRDRLYESEGYVDKSVKTLKGMARRMATNRMITIAIIVVLILLILAVLYSKFK